MSTPRKHLFRFLFPLLAAAAGAPASAAQGGSLAQLPFANPEFRSGDYPSKLAHGDLDGDGDQDVVAATAGDFDFIGIHTGTTITVHPNLGGGILAELGAGGALALPTGKGPASVAVADFDGDLDQDIASADQEVDAVTFQRNPGDGLGFDAFSFPAGPDPFGIDAGDLDGDGDPDLALTNLGEGFAPLSRRCSSWAPPGRASRCSCRSACGRRGSPSPTSTATA